MKFDFDPCLISASPKPQNFTVDDDDGGGGGGGGDDVANGGADDGNNISNCYYNLQS